MTKHTYPERINIYLQDFDYSQNSPYFITIVTHKRVHLFGSVIRDTTVLKEAGKILARVCHEIPEVIPEVKIDTFQIMPNHLHAILIIERVGSGLLSNTTLITLRLPRLILIRKQYSLDLRLSLVELDRLINQTLEAVWQQQFRGNPILGS